MSRQTPVIPDPTALSRALADSNDWRAVMIVLVVVIAMLIGFIIWREFSLVRLAREIDRIGDKMAGAMHTVGEAMWALRVDRAREEAKDMEADSPKRRK